MKYSRSIATVGLALALVGVPRPASADTRLFTDPVGDVRHGLDIHRVRVQNEQRVVVTTWHRRVQRGSISIFIDTRPAAGPEYHFGAGVGSDTDWQISRMRNWKIVGRGPINCPSGYGFSRRTDTVRASISLACLNGPNAVRVSVKVNADGRGPDWAPGYRRFFRWVGR